MTSSPSSSSILSWVYSPCSSSPPSSISLYAALSLPRLTPEGTSSKFLTASDHLDFLHPLYTDYDPGDLSGVPLSPGTHILGSPPGLDGLSPTNHATVSFWE